MMGQREPCEDLGEEQVTGDQQASLWLARLGIVEGRVGVVRLGSAAGRHQHVFSSFRLQSFHYFLKSYTQSHLKEAILTTSVFSTGTGPPPCPSCCKLSIFLAGSWEGSTRAGLCLGELCFPFCHLGWWSSSWPGHLSLPGWASHPGAK